MDWNLETFFKAFKGPTYSAFRNDLKEELNALTSRVETLNADPARYALKDWETLLFDYEHVQGNFSHLSSYLACLTAADANNDDYLKEENAFADFHALLSKLTDKIMRGLARMEDRTFAELIERDRLSDAAYLLTLMREQALKRMPGDLEELTADLGVNGIGAWSRLYFTSMGNLKFRYTDPQHGATEVPMAQLNSLLSSSSRERRIAAYEGSVKTLEEHKYTTAAAINAISGTRHTLNKRRGIDQFLEPSLQQAHLTHATLTALMTAIEDRLPFGREVFRFRTDCMGINDPGWVDLRAPLPLGDDSGPTWEDGVNLISTAFNSLYPALGSFFDEMIEKRWIDHSPRAAKRPGGFCTTSQAIRESRIFMTYKDTLNDVMTLAHEAGHAWHSRLLKDERVFASRYPMTLAESASTFAERVLTEGVLRDDNLEPVVKLVLLDAEVEHMLAFLLDLPIRFRFEQEVYERRKQGVLSPNDLCRLMKETQRKVFGEAMTEGREDPWFWSSKMHFYIEGVQFYNYPYTFGYLLSTAYMERFRENADGGLNAFERFLSNSGKMSCEDVVRETLGEDIEDPNFWAAQIDCLQRPFALYKDMIRELTD